MHESSHDEPLGPISAELICAYRRTLFVIRDQPELIVRIGDQPENTDVFLGKHRATSAIIVSAWNPFSQTLPAHENASRAAALKQEIDKLELRSLSAEGRDPDGKWPSEESLCVFDAAPTMVDQWMRSFGQNAVVRLGLGMPVVLVFHPKLRSAEA